MNYPTFLSIIPMLTEVDFPICYLSQRGTSKYNHIKPATPRPQHHPHFNSIFKRLIIEHSRVILEKLILASYPLTTMYIKHHTHYSFHCFSWQSFSPLFAQQNCFSNARDTELNTFLSPEQILILTLLLFTSRA